MAYLSVLRQGKGRYTTICATVARWGELKGGRHGAVQERLYVGRLDSRSGRVRLSKGIVGTADVRVGIEDLRAGVGRRETLGEIRAWLVSLCPGAAPGPVVESPATTVFPADERATALVGQTHVLLALAEGTGLQRCLIAAFGGEHGLALLYLAMHQAVRGEPLYLAGPWLEDLWLPPALAEYDFSSPGLSRLMAEVGRAEEARQVFYRDWMTAREHPRGLIYDLTSISTYAAALEAAAYGYNRDGESLPQENLALVCSRSDGMPLFCRLIPGSVPDVSTLDATARILRSLGLVDCEFSLDRGFFSQGNIRELLLNGHHFTMGALLSSRQAVRLLAKHRAALRSPKHAVYHEGRAIHHVRDNWTVDMGRDGQSRKRHEDKTVEAHLFFDPRRHGDRSAAIEERVFELERKAARETFAHPGEVRRWLAENARPFASCLGLVKKPDGKPALRRKPKAIAARTATCGYQVVLCDTPGREATTVLTDYLNRDRAEKLFDLLKNDDGQHRLRTGRQDIAEGRVFLAFLALILRAEIENRLRTAKLLAKTTVAEYLAEMGRIRAIRLLDGTRLVREVTKRQRDWLEAVGLPPPQP